MQFPKSQIFEICLMEAVKSQPVLYDRDSAGYSNKQEIDQAWENVLAEVSKKVKDVNVTHCKLRWRSLRDRYVKQFIKTTNGAIVEPDLSKWAYNAQLHFLRKHLKKRKYGCEKPPSHKKRAVIVKKIKNSPMIVETAIVESINPFDNENTLSDNSSCTATYEQDIQVEIDSLEDYECPMEAEIAEVEFIPFKPKDVKEPTEKLPANASSSSSSNIPEVSNEVVVDPFSINDNNDDNQDTEITTNIANDDQQQQPAEASASTTSTEECINNLLLTVNNLLKEQQRKDSQKSPNEEYFKVLDEFLKKFPKDELNKIKVDILNFVLNKSKALQQRRLLY